MCFTIPYRIEKVENDTVTVEGGKKVKLGGTFKVKRGEYLQVLGNIAVSRLSKNEGAKIRSMIKNIYEG